MRQKLFSFRDDFIIKDESDRDMFRVIGQVFSFGKQLSFYSIDGQELAFIRQQVFAWGPTYEIYRGGQLYATVKKNLFSFFSCIFEIDIPGPNDLRAEGDFSDHNYRIVQGPSVVGFISKQWFSWADSYGVDTAVGCDDILLLACTVVIDMACHEGGHDHGAGLLGGLLDF